MNKSSLWFLNGSCLNSIEKGSKDENFSSLNSLRVLIQFKANLKPSFQNFGRRGNKDWNWSYQGTSNLETFQSSNYKLWLKGLRYGTLSGKIPRKIKLLEGDVGGIRMIWWKNLGIMEFKENFRPLWISMPNLPPTLPHTLRVKIYFGYLLDLWLLLWQDT